MAVGPRAGPVQADVQFNEAWTTSYTLTGDGTAGPYTLREPVTLFAGGDYLGPLSSGATTYTYVGPSTALGSTNYTVDRNGYQILFGSTIPNAQPIAVTEANLFGAEGVSGLNLYSMFVAIVGSVVVLVIYHTIFGRSTS
jgi:hypothetical protein